MIQNQLKEIIQAYQSDRMELIGILQTVPTVTADTAS